jgi:8-oxo-dGTP pyrophosphatase MutT (NUDIX family)
MELWDIRERSGRLTGRTVERGQPLATGEYHLVVDIWVINAQGEYLVSRRADDKYPDPGLWEPTCGSVVAGEDGKQAALREVREELGIELNPDNGWLFSRFVLPDTIVDVWLFTQEADINDVILQPGETADARWADAEHINKLAADGLFLPKRRIPYLCALFEQADGV